jgi:hypothetical protein
MPGARQLSLEKAEDFVLFVAARKAPVYEESLIKNKLG